MDQYLYWLVAVAGEVLGEETNDEAAPETSGDAEEDLPVADEAGRVLGEDARESCWQSAVADDKDSLHEPATRQSTVDADTRGNVGQGHRLAAHEVLLANLRQDMHGLDRAP